MLYRETGFVRRPERAVYREHQIAARCMPAPLFLEAHISQVPAIRLLQQIGYTYLSPEDVAVERRGKMRHVLLEKVLANQLNRLNRISFKGREVRFTAENIASGIAALREVPFDGLVRTSEKV